MKNNILLVVMSALSIYLAMAFVVLELDFRAWNLAARIISLLLTLLLCLIIKDQQKQ